MSAHHQVLFIVGMLLGAATVVLVITGAILGRAIAARLAWKAALTQKDRP